MTRGPDAAALNNLADAVVGQLPRMLADVYALLEARDADYAAFLAAEYDEVLGAAGHFVRRLFEPDAAPGAGVERAGGDRAQTRDGAAQIGGRRAHRGQPGGGEHLRVGAPVTGDRGEEQQGPAGGHGLQ